MEPNPSFESPLAGASDTEIEGALANIESVQEKPEESKETEAETESKRALHEAYIQLSEGAAKEDASHIDEIRGKLNLGKNREFTSGDLADIDLIDKLGASKAEGFSGKDEVQRGGDIMMPMNFAGAAGGGTSFEGLSSSATTEKPAIANREDLMKDHDARRAMAAAKTAERMRQRRSPTNSQPHA